MSYSTNVIVEALPTYHQATDPNAPPPTYDSIQGKLQEVHVAKGTGLVCGTAPPPTNDSINGKLQEVHFAKGPVGFIAKLTGLVGDTDECSIAIALMSLIPIILIITGGINWSNCPAEPWIPRWLVISGVLAMIMIATGRRRQIILDRPQKVAEGSNGSFIRIFILLTLVCLMLAWLTAGVIWVWSTSPLFADCSHVPRYCLHSPRYCDKLTFAVAYTASIVIFYLLFFLLSLFVFMIFCYTVIACLTRRFRFWRSEF